MKLTSELTPQRFKTSRPSPTLLDFAADQLPKLRTVIAQATNQKLRSVRGQARREEGNNYLDYFSERRDHRSRCGQSRTSADCQLRIDPTRIPKLAQEMGTSRNSGTGGRTRFSSCLIAPSSIQTFPTLVSGEQWAD